MSNRMQRAFQAAFRRTYLPTSFRSVSSSRMLCDSGIMLMVDIVSTRIGWFSGRSLCSPWPDGVARLALWRKLAFASSFASDCGKCARVQRALER